jgi:ABC-type Fe3+-siderophore transport system permease subunit
MQIVKSTVVRSFLLLVLMALLAFLFSLQFGTSYFGPIEVINGLIFSDSGIDRTIIWEIRFPRSLSAALVGAGLGLAGAMLQVTTRNPLADPAILGISALAGLALALVVVIFPLANSYVRGMACIAGGVAGGGLILILSRGFVSPLRITIVGVAVGAFASACIIGLITGSRVVLDLALGFLAGGLYGSGWEDAFWWIVFLPLMCIGIISLANRLDNLALGDEIAINLGENPDRTRAAAVLFSGLMTGIAVSISGLVSFVGLASPHIARAIVGRGSLNLFTGSILVGSIIMLVADTVARVVISPSELPAGILTAFVGAPILIYLVRSKLS